MNTAAQRTRTRTRTNRLSHKVAALMLFLAAASSWAQQPVEDTPIQAQQTPTQSPQSPAQEVESPAPAQPSTTTPEEEAVADTPDSTNSPFDYRASEKISEDLSVSFPVDI